jgi:hypothetical protein
MVRIWWLISRRWLKMAKNMGVANFENLKKKVSPTKGMITISGLRGGRGGLIKFWPQGGGEGGKIWAWPSLKI